MIIAKIVQEGQIITLKDVVPTFQYSANLEIQFIKDERYSDYKVIGFYKAPGYPDTNKFLVNKEGIFNLESNVFLRKGILRISFALYKKEVIIHLNEVEFEIKRTLGNANAVLPENDPVWMELVKTEVKECLKDQVIDIVIDFATNEDIKEIIKEVFQ